MQMPRVPLSQIANDGRLTPLWILAIVSFVVLVMTICLLLHIGDANAILDDLGWGLKIGFGLASAHSLGTTFINRKPPPQPPTPPSASA